MSTFTVCGKRIMLDIRDAQSLPQAAVRTDTAFAILKDSNAYLTRKIRSEFEDGVPATVAIMRPPWNCDTGTDCDETALCNATATAVDKVTWETINIDDCVQSAPKFIEPTDYEAACNGRFTDAFRHSVELSVNELKRKFNDVSYAYLKANAANWTDGSATKVLPIAAATTGVGLYPTWANLQYQFASVGMEVKPNVIGGAPIYQILAAYSVPNPLTGIGPASSGPVSLYVEPLFDQSTPANQVIVWSPQSVQVVTYNRFFNDFAQGTRVKSIEDVYRTWQESRVRSTGTIPVIFRSMENPSETYVVYAEFEGMPDNCGKFKYQLKINYKFVKVLTQVCNDNGFNGIFTFTTCAPTIPACPAEPDPVVPLDYCMDWDDTPCESPYEITSVTLGGATYTGVPMNYTDLASLVAIINAFAGEGTVYLSGGSVHSTKPLADGYVNDSKYPFSFSVCGSS